MKKFLIIISIVMVSFICYAQEEKFSSKENIQSEYPAKKINVPHALLRGTANLCTFWMEIPRELVLESNYNPAYGIVTGAVKGSYYGGKRLLYSVIDIAMLGFTGPSGYSRKFPEFVWQAKWAPWPRDENKED